MQRFDQEPEILFMPFAVTGERAPGDGGAGDESPDRPPAGPAGETFSGPHGPERLLWPADDDAPGGPHVPAAGVLARRIPDFLHHLLNDGHGGPTGMLEIHSPPDEGPLRWITLRAAPGPEEIRSIVDEVGGAEIFVAGGLEVDGGELRIGLRVYYVSASGDDGFAEPDEIAVRLPLADPVPGLLVLAHELATLLGIDGPGELTGQVSAKAEAFYRYLEGLDGAAMLSGDSVGPERLRASSGPATRSSVQEDADAREELVRPLVDAIRIDPRFGLALRTTAMTLAVAVHGDRMTPASCARVVDQCLSCGPMDGEGCVALAEQLVGLGDDRRAQAWLEHATGLDSPPARGLESLGVLLANRGRPGDARALWTRGLDEDGNPDFLAHLSRLAFHEGRAEDGWAAALEGLRRMRERELRAGEWNASDLGRGILLRYLSEHCAELDPPDAVVDALLDLCDVFDASEKRIELGLCLIRVGEPGAARGELVAGVEDETDEELRDRGLRGLLALDVPDFEASLEWAVDAVEEFERALETSDREPPSEVRSRFGDAAAWFADILERERGWCPAVVHGARALRLSGRGAEALDLLWDALHTAPGHPQLLGEMALAFADRGNHKRALECVQEALESDPRNPALHLVRVRWLNRLGRPAEALAAVRRAVELVPGNAALRSLSRELQTDLDGDDGLDAGS